jgi:hypothetical protein
MQAGKVSIKPRNSGNRFHLNFAAAKINLSKHGWLDATP